MTTTIREGSMGDMGAGRRNGRPRTDAQRRARHKRLHGTSKLPARGTGLGRI